MIILFFNFISFLIYALRKCIPLNQHITVCQLHLNVMIHVSDIQMSNLYQENTLNAIFITLTHHLVIDILHHFRNHIDVSLRNWKCECFNFSRVLMSRCNLNSFCNLLNCKENIFNIILIVLLKILISWISSMCECFYLCVLLLISNDILIKWMSFL